MFMWLRRGPLVGDYKTLKETYLGLLGRGVKLFTGWVDIRFLIRPCLLEFTS
jgi:hypothetical protein